MSDLPHDLKFGQATAYANTFKNTFGNERELTYQNPFSNNVEPSEASKMEAFTAVGNPQPKDKDEARGRGLNALSGADSWGAGAPNLLPVRFTDESIISVPVMPPAVAEPAKDVDVDPEDDEGPVKGLKQKSRFSLSSFRRKSGSSKPKQPEFVMKDMPRSEYLKHYAKDAKGKYIGTEDPARDCILKNREDIMKYRKQYAAAEAWIASNAAPIAMC